MRLFIVRHATAEPRLLGRADAERALTSVGEREARHAGRALRRLGVEPTLLVTSPLRRSRDTASLMASELGVEPRLDPNLGPGFSTTRLGAVVGDLEADGIAILVGHEPDLSTLIAALTGARVRMAKGAIAEIDTTRADDGELRSLLRPAQVRRLGQRIPRPNE